MSNFAKTVTGGGDAPEKPFKLTDRQREGLLALQDPVARYTLLEGGSRSGKTLLVVYNMICRCQLFANTRHLSCRLHRVKCEEALWKETRRDVLRKCFPNLHYVENNSMLYMTFENGSEYWFGGLDEKDGKDGLLGREWATIHVDEATEVPLKTEEKLRTRLAQKGVSIHGVELANRMWLTCNPVLKKHHLYKRFVLGENPETGLPFPEHVARRYNRFRINPVDNLANINEEYLETLETLSPERRMRFLYGEWQDENRDALFRYDDINRARVGDGEAERLDFDQVAVAVDPAGSAGRRSDETGIVAVGWTRPPYSDKRSSGHYYILDDWSGKYEPEEWARRAFELWHKWNARCLSVVQVYESNFGGNMVELTLRSASRVPVIQRVSASKGKAVRAEPVAALSARGELHVCGSLPELEDQMASWVPDSGEDSPNRLDAMVWGVSYILNGKAAKRAFVW